MLTRLAAGEGAIGVLSESLSLDTSSSAHIATFGSLATDARTVQMKYPDRMDQVEALREKVGRLRVEIAQIQELNKQHRPQGGNSVEAQVAHGQRQERLQAIQQELAQLASLGWKVQSVEEMKKRHRIKKAS